MRCLSQACTMDFKWQVWSDGGKNQNPKKSLDQNLTPKKSHPGQSQNKFGCALFKELCGQDTQELSQIFRLFWIPPKIPTLIKLPKKILAIIFLPKKSRNQKFKTQIYPSIFPASRGVVVVKVSRPLLAWNLQSSLSLEIQSDPWGVRINRASVKQGLTVLF